MSDKEKFSGFTFDDHQYEAEARERWGDDAIDRTKEKISNFSTEEKTSKKTKMNEIFSSLAMLMEQSPNDEEVQALIKTWHEFLNDTTGYHYTLEAFQGLGQIYLADERFTENIDQFGQGLAQFMSNAINMLFIIKDKDS